MIDAICLVDGDAVYFLPESGSRPGLPSLINASSWAGTWWFCLTDAFGARQYAYVTSRLDGDRALCILSKERSPTAFFHLLEACVSLARNIDDGLALRALVRLLCSSLPRPTPGVTLRLELPAGVCVTLPSSDVDDELLWDGLVALGLSAALEAWHALLFERPVLLLGDTAPLLTAACDVLILLRKPLSWDGTYVPALPPSLLDAVEAPTPFLMGCGRTAFLANAARLDTSPILVVDLDTGGLARPSAAGLGFEPLPTLPGQAATLVEPLVPLLSASRHPNLRRLRQAAATVPPASECLRTARRCFGALLHSILRPDALLSARGSAAITRPLRGSALELLDWSKYLSAIPSDHDAAAAKALAEELQSTLGFEGLVASLLRPLDGAFDEAQTFALPSSQPAAAIAICTVRIELQPKETAAARADCYSLHLQWVDADSPAGPAASPSPILTTGEGAQRGGGETWEALRHVFDELRGGAGEAVGAAGEAVSEVAGEAAAAAAGKAADAAAGEAAGEAAGSILSGVAGDRVVVTAIGLAKGDALTTSFARSCIQAAQARLYACDEEDQERSSDAAQIRLWRATLQAGCGTNTQDVIATLRELDNQIDGALRTLARADGAAPTESCEVAVAITRLDAAAVAFELLAASSVVGSASNELVDAVQANVAEANAASAAAATAGGAAGGRGRALASARLASLIAPEPPQSTTDTPAARPRESSTGLNRSPAGKSGSGSGSGSHLSSEAEAPEAAGLAEKLVEEMIVLFASQADACGFVGKAELLRISASARLGELTARTALLRRVEPSTLGADAQLAFWLNVYNLCCMHGFAVNAKLLPTNGSVLSVLRLHSNFVYNIGGRSLSVVDIEHAVLRASQPRPSFLISFLIPKFALSDPRRDLAFAALPSPLLSFGLVAGTAFSPPLRTYSAAAVHEQLEQNARAVLAQTVNVLDATPGRLHLSLPAQLRWHRADVGASLLESLSGVLRPLLPPRAASVIDPVGSAPHRTSWSNMSWLVRFQLAEGRDETTFSII